ncbi:toxin-antitoxin system YwqK family antitoxin [Melittangium boletus]|uniref:toxin-antitoxin system YwqK family antitoxin n=1 Tax=Melittangium boletus TaxID=83453 RepID=UPI003DA4E614
MSLKKWTGVVGVFAAMVVAPISFAKDSTDLNCPSGTRQERKANKKLGDMAACIKTDVKEFTPHGTTVYFHPNGMKQAEGLSENGLRTGLWTFFDEKGQKTGTANFKRSNFHGEVTELFASGTVKKVEQYADGLRQGMVKEFSADGRLVKQTEYRDNREVAAK